MSRYFDLTQEVERDEAFRAPGFGCLALNFQRNFHMLERTSWSPSSVAVMH
jgi:hypothetical protein